MVAKSSMLIARFRNLFLRRHTVNGDSPDEEGFGTSEIYDDSDSYESYTIRGHSAGSIDPSSYHAHLEEVDIYSNFDNPHEYSGSLDEPGIAFTTQEPSRGSGKVRAWSWRSFSEEGSDGCEGPLIPTSLKHKRLDSIIQETLPDSPLPRVSLVSKLPPEILAQIFLYCCSLDSTQMNTKRPQIVLGHVCRSWRDTALSTSALWSYISVMVSDFQCSPCPALLQLWLDRSGSHPLCISLVYTNYLPPSHSERSLEEVLDLLVFQASRWQEICVNSHRLLLALNSKLPSDGIPMLDHIELSLGRYTNPYSYQPEDFALLFKSSPRLQGVTYRGPSHIPSRAIPWSQLTHIDLETRLSSRDCLEILRIGRQLVDCRFHMENAGSTSLDNFPLLVHHLRSLYISSQENLGGFFDHLILPKLSSLGISARWTPARILPSWPQRQFISLLTRSSSPITSFSVRCLVMTDEEFLECLLYLSDALLTIEAYVVGCDGASAVAIGITDTVLQALTFTENPCLCPRLKNITFFGCIRSTDGVLANMIASRWKVPDQVDVNQSSEMGISRIEHVEMSFSCPNHEKDARYLRTMLADGLSGTVVSNC